MTFMTFDSDSQNDFDSANLIKSGIKGSVLPLGPRAERDPIGAGRW
jgi:hypothetical protein